MAVEAGSVAMVFTFGTPMSYGIFRDPFSEAFGVSPLALSGVFAIMLFAHFIGSGLVGIFGSRYPARALLGGCALATAVLAPSLYVTNTLPVLALVFAVLGLALGTAFVVVASVVPRWFERRRGAATGLIFVGNGVGLFVLPPIWQGAFASVGVRQGFFLVLSASALAFALAATCCRRPHWAEHSRANVGDLLEWLTQLSTSRTFQLLFVGIAFSFAWYQLLAAYAVDLFAARGLTAAGASLAFGLIGGISIVSRIASGVVSDVVGARRAFLASLVCVTLGIVLLAVPVTPALALALVLAGLGLGGTATLYIPLLMEIYSPERDTAIVGVFNVAAGLSALVMPPLGTASIAYTDGFAVALTITLAVTVVGTAAVVAGTAASRSTGVGPATGRDR
ncbi:MFS transporter [Natronobiforma cellulositropha]|uniref:MFS transporter n=1 Tax=Natronobiforma cellulositropha TaxID=1679076 RepID=UPI0021D5FC99|nr:MFS transporter [Natronobiforma cellulositropha]